MNLSYYTKVDTNYSVTKNETGYNLEIDVPGFKKDELKIKSEEGNLISISGKNKNREYSNKFSIARDLDVKKIKATLSDGVLKLSIPYNLKSTSSIEITSE